MQTYVYGSAFQARAILGAWQSGDQQRLHQELNTLGGLHPHVADSGEEERLELLAEIAGQLKCAPTEGTATVVRSLLEHLAFPAKAAIQPLVWGRAAKAALLQ